MRSQSRWIAAALLAFVPATLAAQATQAPPPPPPAAPARLPDPAIPAIQGIAPNQANAGQGDASEGKQSTSEFAQEATRPNTMFPPWYMKSTRDIDPRLRPNAGFRMPGAYTPIAGGPLLYPNWSPVEPDFLGGQATMPWSLRGSLLLAGTDGERSSSKFEEYRDVRDGVTAGIEAHYRNGNALFNLVGRQLGRADQDLNMDGGIAGRFLWTALYDETPHNYAFGAKTLFSGIGTGYLSIADAIQTDLQNSASNLELGAKANAYVQQQGVAVDESLRRQKTGGDITLLASYPWVIKGGFTNESRDGVRPWSGSFGFGHFDEMPWPVQYDTRDTRLSAEWAKPESRVYFMGGYRYSDFANHIDSFVWDNPFRITDAPNPGLGNPLIGPATGRMSLYPSNQYHEGTGSVVVKKLPFKSTFNALASFGAFRQNEQLIPFSTNTAPIDTLSSPTNPSFAATDLAGLPRQTAQTAMDSTTIHARWTGELSKKVRFVGQYRLYKLVNNEDPFRFNMFVREDQDRRLPETAGGTYLTVPADFARSTATGELSYNFGGDSRLNFVYTFDRINRDEREITWSNDNKLKAGFDTRRWGWLELKSWYEHTTRSTALYDFNQYNIYQGNQLGHPMLPWIEKFDEAPYHRHEGQVMATAYIGESMSVSAHTELTGINYGQVQLDPRSMLQAGVTAQVDPNNQFGVRWERRYAAGLDFTYSLNQRLNLFADIGFDRWEYQQSSRQWTVNGISDPYLREPVNESFSNWVATPRDNYWNSGLGVDVWLVPEKAKFNLQYTFAKSDGRHLYTSALGVAANDVNAFVPTPFYDVDDIKWHTFNPELEWKFKHALSLSAGYFLEKWHIDDYNYKGFTYAPVYNNGVALLMGGLLPPGFNANVAYIRVRTGF